MQHFRSLGNYTASDPTELTLLEGDVVKVTKMGSTGWWYAQHTITQQEGWVPSTYMEPVTDNSLSSISEFTPFRKINQPEIKEYCGCINILGVNFLGFFFSKITITGLH